MSSFDETGRDIVCIDSRHSRADQRLCLRTLRSSNNKNVQFWVSTAGGVKFRLGPGASRNSNEAPTKEPPSQKGAQAPLVALIGRSGALTGGSAKCL